MKGCVLLRRAALAFMLMIGAPALAGIEEHNPNPGPDSMLLDGIIIDRSLEGTQAAEESLSDTPHGGISTLTMATSAPVAQELYVKWELARYGILYVTTAEATAISEHASKPRHASSRPADDERPRGEEAVADLDETRSSLTAEEQAAGCNAGGGSALPTGLAALLLAMLGLTLPRARHRMRLYH